MSVIKTLFFIRQRQLVCFGARWLSSSAHKANSFRTHSSKSPRCVLGDPCGPWMSRRLRPHDLCEPQKHLYSSGLLCQELTFENSMQHDGPGNWTAAGRLRLSQHDMIVFEPKVTVKVTSELCSVNLRTCLPEGHTPPTHRACYCTRDSDKDYYHVFVNSHGDLPLNGLATVEATVPSRYYFSPLSLTTTIGDLPRTEDQGQLLSACQGRAEDWEKKLNEMGVKMEEKLDEMTTMVEKKFEAKTKSMEEKIKKMEKKFEEISTKMEDKFQEMSTKMGDKFNEMSIKFDKKLDEMTTKIENTVDGIPSKMEQKFGGLVRKMDSQFDNISIKMENKEKETSKMVKKIDELTSKIETTASEVPEKVEKMFNEMTTKIWKKLDGIATEMGEKTDETTAQVTTLTNTLAELTNTSNTTDDIHSALVLDTCADVMSSNPQPVVTLSNGLTVVCDTETDDGGWYVIQRRASPEVDFFRNWEDYKTGFGDLHGNFWFGLENTHRLTIQGQYELRVDLTFNGTNYYAKYDNFTILGEPDKYRLLVSGYSGNAGDDLRAHNKMAFSTKDRDSDLVPNNCAQTHHGAWWYAGCHASNLNGLWGSSSYANGVMWYGTTKYEASASFSEMKMRPVTK